jgi:release factor glutamine methyltransferase
MILGETAQTLTRAAAARLKSAGVASAPLDARVMMRHVLGLRFEDMLADPTRRLTAEEERRYAVLIERRKAREPLSHILGKREFWSLSFVVSRDVLDPRPDSETLVEAVLDHVRASDRPDGQGLSILDLGTGSGCLLLALLHELPGASGLGVDFSQAAVAVAESNARRLGLSARARFAESDWFSGVNGTFDIVVSNPPYVRSGDVTALAPEVRDHEPPLALDGGPDGLDAYRRIVSGLRAVCRPDAMVAFEFGWGQADDVAGLLSEIGIVDTCVRRDLAGVARCVTGTAVS